jgi:CTP synthase
MPKYIFVIGGVISGLGKGVVTSAIAKMFQKRGYSVTTVKIDPYLNIDAGTMRPTEHGEVWVTRDGGEIDQDFGHYERFLGLDIPKMNNITTGQIYKRVIEKERKGEYLGKTVQYIPHVVGEAIRRIKECGTGFDVCVAEIGGTIGDYENELFVLAADRIAREQKHNAVFVLVAYLPTPTHLGEMKSKPTQHAIQHTRGMGIQPDYLIARAEGELDDIRKKKIGFFSGMEAKRIISDPNLDSIYKVPMVFEKQNFADMLCDDLALPKKDADWSSWIRLFEKPEKNIKIAMVCKYFDIGTSSLEDSYVSINEALKHAGMHLGCKAEIVWIDSKDFEDGKKSVNELEKYDGVLVPGGFGTSGIEGKISAIRFARENKKPFLGLCLGMQLAVIEYARNVCNMKEANSTEFNSETPNPVIDLLPEQYKILETKGYGATMRLGGCKAILNENSFVRNLYGKEKIVERHRHRYEVNPKHIEMLENHGLVFSGRSPDRILMEFLELPNHPFFVATQAHPEFTSRFERPNSLFLGFVKACLDNQKISK